LSRDTLLPLVSTTEPVESESRTTGQARLLYVDNMRAVLIALVIVGHMAITYGAPLGDWYYTEEGEVGPLFTIVTVFLLGIGASFALGLFYLIAGYFTPRPCDRKGPRRFIVDRLLRLGIPLIFYALVINPLITYWAAVNGGYRGTLPEYVSTHLATLERASVGPLWFVEALLAFSIVYALGRLLFPAQKGAASKHVTRPVPSNGSIALFALGLGLVTFIVRIWAPFGWWLEPVHQEPAHLPQYVALFAAGIVAYRHDWLARLPTAQARVWGWIALALVPGLPALAVAAGALSGEPDPAAAGGLNWLALAYSLWEAFIGVALVIAVLAWFRRRFNHQGALARSMSSSAYAVYVLHPLIIVPLALALSVVQLGLGTKFVLFAPLAVAICFLAGYLVRLVPGLRSIF
jgi:glucan biosynthesis protein C